MKVFLAALVLLALGVFGLCFNIIFRKDGKFPEFDVGSNQEMKKRGIKCMKEVQDEIQLTSKCSGKQTDACAGCSYYISEK